MKIIKLIGNIQTKKAIKKEKVHEKSRQFGWSVKLGTAFCRLCASFASLNWTKFLKILKNKEDFKQQSMIIVNRHY